MHFIYLCLSQTFNPVLCLLFSVGPIPFVLQPGFYFDATPKIIIGPNLAPFKNLFDTHLLSSINELFLSLYKHYY